MIIDLLKELLKTRDLLSDVIIHETPGTKGVTLADFQNLVSRRDRLTVAINTLIGQGFKPNVDLEAALAELKTQNAALEAANATQEAVKKAIDLAGSVLGGLAKVVAFFV